MSVRRAGPPPRAGPAERCADRTRNRTRSLARPGIRAGTAFRLGQRRPEVAWTRSTSSRTDAISIRPGSQLVPGAQVLEQDRPQLDDLQRGLAPGDDGVDTWTVSVVGTYPAVAVAIERCGVTTGSALSLTGDEIHE